MPRRIFLLGLPSTGDSFATEIREAFLDAGNAGQDLIYDTYTHEDSSQLRLLHVDYFLAARFTTVAHELKKKYGGASGLGPNGDAAYFSNIDPDGEKDRRPDLFLPSPAQLGERYEAEVWLASQPALKLIEVDGNGVTLMRRDSHGQLDPLELGKDLPATLAAANHEVMFLVHETLSDRVRLLPDSRQVITTIIEEENKRLESSATSKEYKRWVEMRKHVQSLAP